MHQFGVESQMVNAWKHDRAKAAIDARIKDVEKVTVVDYTRDTSLTTIPTDKAYRVDGVHLYIDMVNFEDMLWSTEYEGEACHKRALRLLNLHYRAVHRALSSADAIRFDFHNQRLHAVVAKPYGKDAEGNRVNRAVAIAKLIMDVLAETGDDDEKIPNAKVRVGIDTGKTLAVNNGRNGNREPLFLGRPANIAAKLASNNKAVGIYLSNEAREPINLDTADDPAKSKLTNDEIKKCDDEAKLGLSKGSIIAEWRKDNEKNPIGSFSFSRATPPLNNLDISVLTPGNSRRMLIGLFFDLVTLADQATG
jgi:class 3 adenylate cyclase